ncbi:hypothetical protein EC140385_03169 [Escherichia coli O145:H28]|nr:hypothetical protein EC12E115_2521 [Escherichia coli O145:H28]GEE24407.1 hypothetical protein EC142179_03341 [Escherichia coli O145:H28]GEE28072.1 hypothetical protein EC151733_02050 [Escherichia coli O145:H28]GEE48041.1 hypothetical protein EC142245_03861 [Escherichia coli O145:H28]GEF87329.1 hypothetical protein ECEH1995_00462 [Escherichia coli O145:H28]
MTTITDKELIKEIKEHISSLGGAPIKLSSML